MVLETNIGIISDTHDCLPLIDKAVTILNDINVGLVLHAGDFVSPFVAKSLKKLNAPLIGVFGNNDGDRELLKKKFAEFGADIRGRFGFITVDGLRIALIHGDDKELIRAFLELECFDVLIRGHTHLPNSYRKGRTLVINPGEASGVLIGRATISLLSTETLEVKTIKINL